jgi:hypothetical protein
MNPRAALWLGRVSWLAVGLTGWFAVGAALDGREVGGSVAAQCVCWAVFGVGLVALVVPSTAGLTALRQAAPLTPVAAALALFGGAGAGLGWLFAAAAILALAAIGSGELGQAFVQASAYGEEDRFPLRPAIGFFVAVVVAWLAWAASLAAGTTLLVHEVWVVGAVLLAVGLAGAWPLGVRCHRLARRWLVVVPAGIVAHDPLVLAETLLVQRQDLVRLGLALAGTEAADLTGPSSGHRVEVAVRQPLKVAFSPTKRGATGRAIHARAFLLAPTRPGRALAKAAERGFPVRS